MSLANRQYQEKRNYIRMKVDTPVSVHPIDTNDTFNGKCRDLSGGGMLVELNTALPVGTKADISIASGHGHNPMLHAKAVVSRVVSKPNSDEHPCVLGLEIIEMIN